MDLAGHRRLHPAAACPAPGSRPAPALGETQPAGQAHPRPCPPRLPAHPPNNRLPGPGAETLPARPRTATGPQEHPAHASPRRAHTPQSTADATTNEEVNNPEAPPHRLKPKLGGPGARAAAEEGDGPVREGGRPAVAALSTDRLAMSCRRLETPAAPLRAAPLRSRGGRAWRSPNAAAGFGSLRCRSQLRVCQTLANRPYRAGCRRGEEIWKRPAAAPLSGITSRASAYTPERPSVPPLPRNEGNRPVTGKSTAGPHSGRSPCAELAHRARTLFRLRTEGDAAGPVRGREWTVSAGSPRSGSTPPGFARLRPVRSGRPTA